MRKPCTSASDYLSKPQNEHRSAIHYVLNTHHNKSVGIGRSLYTDSPTSTISYLLPPFRCPDVYEIYLQKIEYFTLVFQKRLFCDAKEPLLSCKTYAFGTQNNRFCNTLVTSELIYNCPFKKISHSLW